MPLHDWLTYECDGDDSMTEIGLAEVECPRVGPWFSIFSEIRDIGAGP